MNQLILSVSSKNRHPHAVLLAQIPNLQSVHAPHPTIARPVPLRIVYSHAAIAITGPEVQRRADFDAVIEAVYEHLGEGRCVW